MHNIIVVVLYKEKICNSLTLKSLKKLILVDNNCSLIVWDNSPHVINSSKDLDFFEAENVYFKHTPENISLAKIYNNVIKTYDFDYITIFDQDTEISDLDYKNKLNSAISKNRDIKLFLPVISIPEKIYSPARFIFPGKAVAVKNVNPGVNKTRRLTAITSGMTIKKDFFIRNNFLFNENLSLYGIDTDFCVRFNKIENKHYVLDVELNHDLSQFNSSHSLEEQIKKDDQRIDALFVIYKNNILGILFAKFYRIYAKIKRRYR